MSKRATAKSVARSLVHIYKPDPVAAAAHCVKPPRLADPRPWQQLKDSVEQLRAPGPQTSAGMMEQQIAMGTRSRPLLPRWTNSRNWTQGGTYMSLHWPTFTFHFPTLITVVVVVLLYKMKLL